MTLTVFHTMLFVAFQTFTLSKERSRREISLVVGDGHPQRRYLDSLYKQLHCLIAYEVSPDFIRSCRVRLLHLAQLYDTFPSHSLNSRVWFQTTDVLYIGEGATSTVVRQYDGKVAVAVKKFRYTIATRSFIRKICIREAIIMSSLRHENILPFFGVVDNPTALGIVSPFMRNGSLPTYLARNPSANRRNLLVDIAQGLVHLKSCGVIHGDLKGSNILVKDDGVACIADFGLAFYDGDTLPVPLDESSDSQAFSCTVRYMSPERLQPETGSALSTFASDVFSFGMVIYEVFTNQVPFHTWKHDGRIMLGIVAGIRPGRDSRIPDDIWSIAQDCWTPNPSDRPLINEVLERLLATLHQLESRT